MPTSWATSAGRSVRSLPGVLGAVLVCVGVGLVFLPAAFVVAGGFLLLIDRRVG